MSKSPVQIRLFAVQTETTRKPRVRIGRRYHGVHAMRRTHDGIYEELLPQETKTALCWQLFLLDRPARRVPFMRRFVNTFFPHTLQD